MLLDRLHLFLAERLGIGSGAEGAIGDVASGPSGDLGDFVVIEAAAVMAVEFGQPGEGHMGHIHVEAHADGIGRDEVIDLARLIHGDLRISCTWAEGTQHDRRPAAMPPYEFGQRIDIGGGEGDRCRAARQARYLLEPGMGQGREARPSDNLRFRHQRADQVGHGRGTEEHGLGRAPAMQQPVGEDVAAIRIGAELHLVQRDKGQCLFHRH